MGMQVHFTLEELLDAKITISIDKREIDIDYSETRIYVEIEGNKESFAISDDLKDCWFDCGQCSDWSMKMIKWLIQNRICFNAS